jgi:hypothetical protein
MRALLVYVLSTLFQMGVFIMETPVVMIKNVTRIANYNIIAVMLGRWPICQFACIPCKLFADLELGLGNNEI